MVSNIVYENGLYNAEVKEDFLSEYPEGTAKNFRRVFLNSYEMEAKSEKDLYDFSVKDMDALIASHKAPTLLSLRMIVSVINRYILWAMTRELTVNNPIDHLSAQEDWPLRHVTARELLTDRQVMQLEDFCMNAQDACMIRLLFEGVGGKAYEELINLQIQDVNFENHILTLRQEHKTRELNVSTRLLGLVQDAYAQTEYYVRNGSSTLHNGKSTTDLIPSKHVLKASKLGPSDNITITKSVVRNRINVIFEIFGLDNTTTKVIVLSGMLYYAKALYERDGKLEKEQYKELADRYDRNFWWTLSHNITVEVIEAVYGE